MFLLISNHTKNIKSLHSLCDGLIKTYELKILMEITNPTSINDWKVGKFIKLLTDFSTTDLFDIEM